MAFGAASPVLPVAQLVSSALLEFEVKIATSKVYQASGVQGAIRNQMVAHLTGFRTVLQNNRTDPLYKELQTKNIISFLWCTMQVRCS